MTSDRDSIDIYEKYSLEQNSERYTKHSEQKKSLSEAKNCPKAQNSELEMYSISISLQISSPYGKLERHKRESFMRSSTPREYSTTMMISSCTTNHQDSLYIAPIIKQTKYPSLNKSRIISSHRGGNLRELFSIPPSHTGLIVTPQVSSSLA